MTDYSYDGAPTQAGLCTDSTHMTGTLPHFSGIGLRLMVVTEVKYIDQPGNRSRKYAEYTCRDIMTNEFAYGCRPLVSLGGIDSGEDNTIAPASKLRDGARTARFTKNTAARDTDGTVVLVGFVEGSKSRGVILGAVAHQYSTLGATAEDGERRLVRHKGTSVEFKKDGTYVITRKVSDSQSTITTVTPSGDVTVRHHSGAKVDVITNLVTVDAQQVKLGAAAVEAVSRGTSANASVFSPVAGAATALGTAIAAAVTTLAPDVMYGVPSGATITALANTLGALATFSAALNTAMASFTSTLSTKVKVE